MPKEDIIGKVLKIKKESFFRSKWEEERKINQEQAAKLEENSSVAEKYLESAKKFIEKGMSDQAIEQYAKIIQLKTFPDLQILARDGIADVYGKLQRWDDEIKEIQELINWLDTADIPLKQDLKASRYAKIGDVFLENKDNENAVKYYEKALGLASSQRLKEWIDKRLKEIQK